MHVVLVTCFSDSPDHIDGGVAGVSRYLADELVKHEGVKVSIVVVPKGRNRETTCERREGYDVYRIGVHPLGSFLPVTPYDFLFGKRRLHRFLSDIKADIVHFQGAAFLAANCPFPSVLTIHGILERDALWSAMGPKKWVKYCFLSLTEGYGRRKAPNVILISEYVREFLKKTSTSTQKWLIENPVADRYFDIDWTPEQGRIFCCGKVIPRKNVLGLLRAFALLRRQCSISVKLCIGGSMTDIPAYVDECKRFVCENNLGDRIEFLGNLSIEQVQAELSLCNCLVIPSYQETAPLAIEEAMAAGVPIVGSGVCGLPYMIEEGKTGYLIDPDNVEQICSAIMTIVEDKNVAVNMSHRAKEIAATRFRASDVAKATLDVYRNILDVANQRNR